MTVPVESIYFLSLLFVALSLMPAGAHLLELPNKLRLRAAEYRTVQQIYRGWAFAGIVVVGAILSTAWLAVELRGRTQLFYPAVIASGCVGLTQFVFWAFTFPVNRKTSNWTHLPPNWIQLRRRWEYSHAISAVLTMVAAAALLVVAMRQP